MPKRLEGTTAIVTGGCGRIGKATAKRLATEGARVAIADILEDQAMALAAEIGSGAIGIGFDAADVGSVERMIDTVAERFGRLDILHNNHAKQDREMMEEDVSVLGTSFELWDTTMAINLRGFFATSKFAIPHMIQTGGGSIIHMSSGSGFLGDDRGVAYGASKAAIVNLSMFIATQHGTDNIRSNCISPGVVADKELMASIKGFAALIQEHTLTTRLGVPEDIAAMVAFLASEEAGYITGQCYEVNGGMLAHQPYMADLRRAGTAGKVMD